ncbi:MAG TPA: HIT domain-containing protein [Verrucomicrobiae bacterium]|nr:HIT domain-containing protein [Verrucomicrobiae bacterium]
MDFLWTPWRYRYLSEGVSDNKCIFCEALALGDDAKSHIVFRGNLSFIILNRFPYTTAHVMIVPYEHVADLARCNPEALAEIMRLAQKTQTVIAGLYRPQGFNLGMNLGHCAGAGVTGHIHMHLLPRWAGDANFMTTVAETRLEPEELSTTYDKLKRALAV